MKKKIILACKNCASRNYKTNKSLIDRLEVKKFCRKCREHSIHKEEK